jgi:hypothetical protein
MPEWETVHTVTDWYDGERLGIADYGGKPHLYESRWDDSKDYWEGEAGEENYRYHYWLSPLSAEVFAWGMEDWAIWQRWRTAFDQGIVDISSDPALPEDRARHEQLRLMLGNALSPGRPDSFRVVGKFEVEGVVWAPTPTRQNRMGECL